MAAPQHVSDKEVRHFHSKTIRPAVRGNVLHLPVCADDAVSVAIYRRAHRQGAIDGRARRILLAHGTDARAAGTAARHSALVAHNIRQPGRKQRAHGHKGSRNIAHAGFPPAHSHIGGYMHHLALFPEQHRPRGQQENSTDAHLDEAEKPRARNSRGNILRRHPQQQHICAEERPEDGQALRHHDLPHDGQLRRSGHNTRRLGHAAGHGRQETPAHVAVER